VSGHDDESGERQCLARRGALTEVNARIREAAGRLDADSLEPTWEFMCECGTPDCRTHVSLTLAAYEELRDADRPVLADGHDLGRGASARRKAREQREDAHALAAQAKLQARRARRLLRRGDP